jgi:predicted transcriptional regulator
MSDTTRVQRWREAKRQHGLKAVTIWLTQEEEMRLKDLALQAHCSPSTLVQQALAQFTPTRALDISIPPDTLLLRQLIREELTAMQATLPPGTGGVTVTPPAGADAVTETVTETVTDAVTETVTDAVTETMVVPEAGGQAHAYGALTAQVVDALTHRQPATAAELATVLGDRTKAGTKKVWQVLQRLVKRGAVHQDGRQYRLPAAGA